MLDLKRFSFDMGYTDGSKTLHTLLVKYQYIVIHFFLFTEPFEFQEFMLFDAVFKFASVACIHCNSKIYL